MIDISNFNPLVGVNAFASQDELCNSQLRSNENFLQVTVSNRVFLLDLKQKDVPAVKEFESTDKVIDVNRIVNPGVYLASIVERSVHGTVGLKRTVEMTNSGNYYTLC